MRNLLTPLIVLIAMFWPAPKEAIASMLEGKRLRYLIGNDGQQVGSPNEITEVSYWSVPALHGISIGYCNLFDEEGTKRFGPYLKQTDTAIQYKELVPDPRGAGFEKNLREQFARRKKQGFQYIELDNPDAYSVADVLGAIILASEYGLKVIAKNPLLMEGDPVEIIKRTHGVIVERGAGSPKDMDALRVKAGKPSLPVWFVAFGGGHLWAQGVARLARSYKNMYVSYSASGEYGSSEDIN